ncbi:MAG TPA: SUMF1/EgtB/PvdO family nonheme iron enzyme, partial [Bacteroidales bacterium]|nr:SUMF1/EgtB/PvdO family nonheme iron enzyme [Bacteroidales bacterium]
PGLSDSMESLISRCLEKDHKERFSEFSEITRLIENEKYLGAKSDNVINCSGINISDNIEMVKSTTEDCPGKKENIQEENGEITKEYQINSKITNNTFEKKYNTIYSKASLLKKSKIAMASFIGLFVIILMIILMINKNKNENIMVFVKGGVITIGKTSVYVDSFYMSRYEVTQKEWNEVMPNNPSHNIGDQNPVECVSWYDTIEFCNRMSKKDGLEPVYKVDGDIVYCHFSKNGYRLPTDVEWEYAARGGINQKGYKYSGSNKPGEVSWYELNSGKRTHKVGLKDSNEIGLYDMSGNVWEWCWDYYDHYYFSTVRTTKNPRGPSTGIFRVLRGGGSGSSPYRVETKLRESGRPNYKFKDTGFRIARSR